MWKYIPSFYHIQLKQVSVRVGIAERFRISLYWAVYCPGSKDPAYKGSRQDCLSMIDLWKKERDKYASYVI